ncbi:MAG: kazal domain protein [Flavobacteriales bacterium]|nr:kazal domain protein [Flavobacteriales bacterium]
MKNSYFLPLIITSFILGLTIISCKKDCFDQALYDASKNQGCTTDCPGVTGCDGKTYCNECEANRHGIRVE